MLGGRVIALCDSSRKSATPWPLGAQVHADKSYDWQLKTPPSSWFIKKAAGLARGSDRAGHDIAATISLKHLYEIARVKHADLTGTQLQGTVKSLMHQCGSMGVRIVARPEDA